MSDAGDGLMPLYDRALSDRDRARDKVVRVTVLVDEFKRRADEADRRDEPNAYARRVVWDRAAEMLRDALKDQP